MEEWRPIKDFEGLYKISNTGRVFSIRTERVLKCGVNSSGYSLVVLAKNGINKSIKVHRLVALAFLPNPENKRTVNHKDTNKHNNYFKNLEWVTQSENIRHSIDVLGKSFANGENHGRSKLTQSDVNDIKEMLSVGCKLRVVAEKFGVSIGAISLIKNGKNWKSHVQ